MNGSRIGQLDDPADDVEPPASERPTNPPPPSYAMLRDSTVPAGLDDLSLDDSGETTAIIDRPSEHDAAALDVRVPERVLSEAESEWLSLDTEQLAFLAAIDGAENVAVVAARVGIDANRARTLVAELVRRGVVRFRGSG